MIEKLIELWRDKERITLININDLCLLPEYAIPEYGFRIVYFYISNGTYIHHDSDIIALTAIRDTKMSEVESQIRRLYPQHFI